MTLKELNIGESAVIVNVGGEVALKQHLLDMGIIPNTKITLVKRAPMGDPLEFLIRGYSLTLRSDDAENIEVRTIQEDATLDESVHKSVRNRFKNRKKSSHPGLGEGGVHHKKGDGNPLPSNTTLTFALVGNQNAGKTTLFNQLTGSNQRVGNFPGVTVDRKDGAIRGYKNTLVTDLPGIYSLSPYSSEEIITREFILTNKPNAIINIIDATNIERNLYLTMQLIELNLPIVVALNMMDLVSYNGGTIRINELERALGVPVVPISARNNEGIEELISHAIHVAHYQERPTKLDFCEASGDLGAIHRTVHAIMHLIEDHANETSTPIRFAASKLAEGDLSLIDRLHLDQNEQEMVEHLVVQMENESSMDRASAMADMRYRFIMNVCEQSVIKPLLSNEFKFSYKLDKVLTGKFSAIPLFIAIMAFIFFATFGPLGEWLISLVEMGVESLTALVSTALNNFGINDVVHSLVIDGIFAGVGSVLSFLPYIILLFFFLAILEDTGYMARVAFVMDKVLRKIGLSGRSIVPMLIGFGCTVPAIMASRTLPSERDRKMTILLTPFMSCSAKLPIYAFIAAAFFSKNVALVMILLYLFAILVGVLVAFIMRKTLFKGEPVPFVMELPNYRLPKMKSVLRLLWDKSKDFITRAFTVIFIATIVIWFLQTFDFRFNIVEDSQNSLLAIFAGVLAPLFIPLGFGNWQVVTALITGFMAKESVVSTMTLLIGDVDAIATFLTPLAALSLLVFTLLYTPCVAAISSVKRELGGKSAFGLVLIQTAIAWVVSFVIYQVGSLLI